MREKRERERDLPRTGVLYSNACYSQSGVRLQSVNRNSFQVSHTGGRNPNTLSHHLVPLKVSISRNLQSENLGMSPGTVIWDIGTPTDVFNAEINACPNCL